MASSRILCVGLTCLDEINVVSDYPVEDSDQRSLDRYTSRGGNASNSSTVLAELGEDVECLSTLADKPRELEMIRKDFDKYGIYHSSCPVLAGHETPISCVIANAKNSSRTIIHTNKSLPELTPQQFKTVITANPGSYTWIHFEGRNKEAVAEMISWLKGNSATAGIPVSVEAEKVGLGFETLIPLGDVVFVSKDVAKANGANNMEEALDLFGPRLKKGASLIVPWGEKGAAALDSSTGLRSTSKAYPPKEGLVNSLGAGDAFIGAMMATLRRGISVEKSLVVACKVAGAKIGRRGFAGLGDIFRNELN